jgi:hypothetical protein
MRYVKIFCIFAALLDPAQTAAVTVTRDDYEHMMAHTPYASKAYTRGVDAYGLPVAPANLGGGHSGKLPETFSMNIDIDLQERFGLPANKGRHMGEIKASRVEVKKDRRAYYNVNELVTGAQNEIAGARRDLQRK